MAGTTNFHVNGTACKVKVKSWRIWLRGKGHRVADRNTEDTAFGEMFDNRVLFPFWEGSIFYSLITEKREDQSQQSSKRNDSNTRMRNGKILLRAVERISFVLRPWAENLLS